MSDELVHQYTGGPHPPELDEIWRKGTWYFVDEMNCGHGNWDTKEIALHQRAVYIKLQRACPTCED